MQWQKWLQGAVSFIHFPHTLHSSWLPVHQKKSVLILLLCLIAYWSPTTEQMTQCSWSILGFCDNQTLHRHKAEKPVCDTSRLHPVSVCHLDVCQFLCFSLLLILYHKSFCQNLTTRIQNWSLNSQCDVNTKHLSSRLNKPPTSRCYWGQCNLRLKY